MQDGDFGEELLGQDKNFSAPPINPIEKQIYVFRKERKILTGEDHPESLNRGPCFLS